MTIFTRGIMAFILGFFLALFVIPAGTCSAETTPSPVPTAASPAATPAPSSAVPLQASPAPAATPVLSPAAPSQASPSPESSPAEEELTEFEVILQKMKMVNRGLRDYSSSVRITGLARYSIIDMNIYAEAVYYYKDPDKHRLKISKGPHYLAQYPQVMGWSLPDPREWTCKTREAQENGRDYIVLKLIPINGMGDLLKTEMWVDKSSYLFSRQVYFYRDNGKLTLDSSYQVVDGFYLFNKLVGHLEFPKKKIKADAEANYGEYKINQGIDDSVFVEEKKK